jgi:glycosyltransferase involved in cell wall biosynthesis
VAFSLASRLPAFDVEVRAVVHREAPFTTWLRDAGVECDVVPDLIETPTRRRADGRNGVVGLVANLVGLRRAARQISALAERHGSRVLYSHNTWGHYVTAGATRMLRASVPGRPIAAVWHIHNDHSRWLTRRVDRAAIRLGRVSAIAAVSASIGQPFAGLSAPLTVVTNGIDLGACEAAARAPLLRAHLGLDADAIVVAYAGRLVAHKGIDVLLEAARLAIPAVPLLHVVILGGRPRHEPHDVVAHLRGRVDEWGLAGRIHLPGHVDDVERYVADADVAVVPSTCADGCPLAAIEALSMGIPVIGSAVGGLPEIVRDRVNGLLVPAGDVRALADAMVTLARERDLRRRMARAARDEARDRFDAVEMTRQVAAVLHQAAQERPCPA